MSTAQERAPGPTPLGAPAVADIDQWAEETSAEAGAGSDDRLRGIADLRSHTARGMIVNSAYQLLLVGMSVVRGLVVAAFVTRPDYGVWGLVGLTMWTALGLKSQFGAGDKYVQQSEENQEHAFQRAFTVELIFTAAAAPIAAVVLVAFVALNGNSSVLAPGLAMLLLLPAAVLQFPVVAYYRQMDYRRQRTLQAVEPLIATITTVSLAIAGAGYWSFVFGVLAGGWAAAIVAIRARPYPLAFRYDSGSLRQYLRFSTPLLVAAVSVVALYQVIFLVGAGPLGLAGLGTFTLVGNLVQFTDQADAIVTATLYPAVCAVRDRLDLLSEIFVKSNRLSLMWAVPFGIGIALFASDLVKFALGVRWLPGVHLLEIMGVVTAVHHVGYNWGAFLKARGVTLPTAVLAVIVSTVVIAAAIPLMYSDHLVGLGYAFALGEAVGLAGRGFVIARFFNGVGILRQLWRAFTPTVAAAVPVLAIRASVGGDGSLVVAVTMFVLYAALTVTATFVLERPLLSEALGYLVRRRAKFASDPSQA